MPLTKDDLRAIRDVVRYQCLATDHDPANPDTFIFPDKRNFGDTVQQGLRNTEVLIAKVDALASTVAVLASHPDITPDALQAMLDTAVARSIQVTGEFHVSPAQLPEATQ